MNIYKILEVLCHLKYLIMIFHQRIKYFNLKQERIQIRLLAIKSKFA